MSRSEITKQIDLAGKYVIEKSKSNPKTSRKKLIKKASKIYDVKLSTLLMILN